MKLSVALCTYNGEKFIVEQINSIVNQSVKVDEIIICDDGSTDNTIKLCESFQNISNTIIKIYQNEKTLRVSKNFEKAIGLTTGDLIFLSDQDDYWEKEKVAKTIAFFKQNPKATGFFSNANLMDENSIVIENKKLWDSVLFLENELNKPIDLYKYITQTKSIVTGATMCFKREILNVILPFPSHGLIHDEWISLQLANQNALFYTNECLIKYRKHANQQIGVIKDKKLEKQKKAILVLNNVIKNEEFSTYATAYKLLFQNYNRYKTLKNAKDLHFDNNTILSNLKVQINDVNTKLKKINFLKYYIFKINNYLFTKMKF